MKRTFLLALPAIICFGITSVLSNFGSAFAQTNPVKGEKRAAPQTSPTPVKTSPQSAPTPPKINEEDEIIKVDTELVNLNVRVIDRNNRPINNLKQAEFKVFEDGVVQHIEFFSKSEVPTNYSLVIDNSGSIAPQFEQVIEAGKILVASNRPNDETSVIRFVGSEKIEIIQDFTTSKTDLIDALEYGIYKEGGQTAIIDAVYLAVNRLGDLEKKVRTIDKKRRAIVLVTDGEDRNSFYTEKQLFALFRETDVQIYVIGFIGDLDKESGFIRKSPQGKAKAFLERMASETGGKAYFPNDVGQLNGIATEISSELRTQYSIGYIPSNEKNDGTFRNIKVVVDDGPNKTKRIAVTRAGRTAEGGSTDSRLKTPNQAAKEQ